MLCCFNAASGFVASVSAARVRWGGGVADERGRIICSSVTLPLTARKDAKFCKIEWRGRGVGRPAPRPVYHSTTNHGGSKQPDRRGGDAGGNRRPDAGARRQDGRVGSHTGRCSRGAGMPQARHANAVSQRRGQRCRLSLHRPGGFGPLALRIGLVGLPCIGIEARDWELLEPHPCRSCLAC